MKAKGSVIGNIQKSIKLLNLRALLVLERRGEDQPWLM